ncbi:40S ribosomal protein S19, putative [Theileria equi strain WA]|uniref:40S ribosomal protein S19, putative n=1 Tax=Theileria equi strain WA TaxID=1537102 RepID=L1LD79_THEEQ|nr:40S ribosomal protein S19, putative [Theileria equi strain WA]EKX73210.1 40S ribosomal protein S19, putative [Theileria equi strain WA]|eukprot:XP_004832662.1 40S ribosomal protein S19, putative [Theileria equi strain WA]
MESTIDISKFRVKGADADVPYRRFNTSLKDCNADLFITAFAEHMKLKGYIECPKWIDYAKTSVAKELSPQNPNWFYVRAAAILRHLYFHPDSGIDRLRKVYSSKKRNGSAPNHTCRASGKIIRSIVQQLESVGFLEQDMLKHGRRLSRKGCNTVNAFARQLTKEVHALKGAQ